MASNNSRFPYNTPTPVGPYNLCDEMAKKSQSKSCTSTSKCEQACAPSNNTLAPTACAFSIISFTGLMVPKALLTQTQATILVFDVSILP